KQPADVVAAIEVEGQLDHLLRREARPRHVAGAAVDAVLAVVQAEVGEQHLEQRDAAAVRRIAVADAGAVGGTQPALPLGAVFRRPAAGAGGVVLGGISANLKLGDQLHSAPDTVYKNSIPRM